jgi:hypothetical protein
MVDQQELEALLAPEHEIRSIEVKSPGSLGDKAYVAQVAKAAMAMGNHHDGGLVCPGIDDKQMTRMTKPADPHRLSVPASIWAE